MMFANMAEPGITEKADRGEVKWNSKPFVDAFPMGSWNVGIWLVDLVPDLFLLKKV